MIICHSHKFVFVKTMKTAGTSLELALAHACQPGDVIARIRPDEPDLAYRQFRHAKFARGDQNLVLRQHSPLARAAQVLGPALAEYRIVTSERNPWRKLVSSFYWKLFQTPEQIADTKDLSAEAAQEHFRAFVLSPVKDPCDAFDMYSQDWMPLADHVIRFEHLAEDLADVARALDLPAAVQLPATPSKGGIAPARPKLVFDAEMDAAVRLRFAREIAAFGYDGPDATGTRFVPPATQSDWRKAFIDTHGERGWRNSA